MVPLIGYLDRLSARPGETIAVKMSSQANGPYAADMVRIIHADLNAAGPGMKLEKVGCGFAGRYPSRIRQCIQGRSPWWARRWRCRKVTRSACGCSLACWDAPQPVLALGGTVLQVSAEGARLKVDGGVPRWPHLSQAGGARAELGRGR